MLYGCETTLDNDQLFTELDTLVLRYVRWVLGMSSNSRHTRTVTLAEAGMTPLKELALALRMKYVVTLRSRSLSCLARRTYEKTLINWRACLVNQRQHKKRYAWFYRLHSSPQRLSHNAPDEAWSLCQWTLAPPKTTHNPLPSHQQLTAVISACLDKQPPCERLLCTKHPHKTHTLPHSVAEDNTQHAHRLSVTLDDSFYGLPHTSIEKCSARTHTCLTWGTYSEGVSTSPFRRRPTWWQHVSTRTQARTLFLFRAGRPSWINANVYSSRGRLDIDCRLCDFCLAAFGERYYIRRRLPCSCCVPPLGTRPQ